MVRPLRLDHSYYPRVSIEADPEGSPNERSEQLHTDVEIARHPEHQDRWQVRLKIDVGPADDDASPPPYRIAMECVGFFVLDMPEEPLARRMITVAVNGASMLYSAAREYLALLTSRGPWGPYQLPTMNFQDLGREEAPEGETPKGSILGFLLERDEAQSDEMADALDLSVGIVRTALRELREEGFVVSERRGRQVYYRLSGGEGERQGAAE